MHTCYNIIYIIGYLGVIIGRIIIIVVYVNPLNTALPEAAILRREQKNEALRRW